jgi:LPXTG-motif cell wall-anchored protein
MFGNGTNTGGADVRPAPGDSGPAQAGGTNSGSVSAADRLANTGTNALTAGLFGLLLCAAGAVIIIARRRTAQTR